MDGGDESVVISAGEADRIEVDPDHEVVGAGRSDGAENDCISQEGSVNAGRLIVAGGAPHAVVDAHRWRDVYAGMSQADAGGRGRDGRGAHSMCLPVAWSVRGSCGHSIAEVAHGRAVVRPTPSSRVRHGPGA